MRERRIGADTAAAWLEMRLADRRRQARQVRAAMLPGDGGDEFSGLFPAA